MPDYPIIEPDSFVAGDLVVWKRYASSLVIPTGVIPAASASWVLSYALVKSGTRIQITATADGDDHLVSVPASTTATYAAGVYNWQSYVTKSPERYNVGSGTIEILTNYAAATSGYDARSHVKKVLDALEAKLENRASRDQEQMVVGGQVIGMMPIAKLVDWYQRYKDAYAAEIAAEKVAAGLGTGKNIFVRFVDD